MLGYGEDILTLWALKSKTSEILESFEDVTSQPNCLIFYRPSFGRSGGEKSAEFGEFDAILVSKENIYLIESKWDNLARFQGDEIIIKPEQELRHRIFSWYIMNWDTKYHDDWASFVNEHADDLQRIFKKKVAPADSTLAMNLQFILTALQEHCGKISSKNNIKNVLLFFYNKKHSKPPTRTSNDFNLLSIDYSQEINGNFIPLD